jgi:hypothetical protein
VFTIVLVSNGLDGCSVRAHGMRSGEFDRSVPMLPSVISTWVLALLLI